METTYQLPYLADSPTPLKRLRGIEDTAPRFEGVIGMALPPDIPSDSIPRKADDGRADDTNHSSSIHFEDVTGAGRLHGVCSVDLVKLEDTSSLGVVSKLNPPHPNSYEQLSVSRVKSVSPSNNPQLVVDSEQLKQPEPFAQSSSRRGDNTMSSLIGKQYHN
ncbi:hypothetical protein M413DRAFT_32482 [Hebeloma cylindrosporum]|uniref:Uncharacterized protein n=1 Tax=Hebeloma cylindrosporum TaxID=76867 RepID=A0A0C3BTP0_HEBCY|nr:hypothetical protein M413DRAFT_32482 [Hebeloma cylindrosporum h7]